MRRSARNDDPDYVVNALAGQRNIWAQVACTGALLVVLLLISAVCEPSAALVTPSKTIDTRCRAAHISHDGHKIISAHQTVEPN